MKWLFLILLLVNYWNNSIISQSNPICGNSILQQYYPNPAFQEIQEEQDMEYAQRLSRPSGLRDHCTDNTVYIPTVIHIIHDPGTALGQAENLDDAAVIQGLEWVNMAFRGEPLCNGDEVGENTNIQFCLAKRDINNGATTGIIHYASNLTDVDLCANNGDDVKLFTKQPIDLFPSSDYINIWLVRSICANCQPAGCDVAGFSTLAGAHGTTTDGYVNEASLWFSNDASACQNAKVGVHEMGHFFNLYHTFDGGCNNANCLTNGDLVCDTPPDNDDNYFNSNPCVTGSFFNSCTSDTDDNSSNNPFNSDVPDLADNFMDYHPVSCSQHFTSGQIVRMQDALCHIRNSFLSSNGCNDPCPSPVTAQLSISPTGTSFDAGTTITFTDNSSNASSTIITINNNPLVGNSYTFSQIGNYTLMITANSNVENCFSEYDVINIEITCPISTAITNLPLTISSGAAYVFNSATTGVSSPTLSWYLDDFNSGPVSIGGNLSSLNHTFNDVGWYDLMLVACNNYCCDTAHNLIQVIEPCASNNLWFNGDFETSNNEALTGIANCPGNPNRGIHTIPWPFLSGFMDHTTGTAGGHLFWSDNALTPCLGNGGDLLIMEQTIEASESCNPFHFSIWTYLPNCDGTNGFPNLGKYKVMVNGVEYLAVDMLQTSCGGWAEGSFDFNITSGLTTVSIYTDDEVYLGYDFAIDDVSITNSCSNQEPILSFSPDPSTSCAPATIEFISTSQNIVDYYWSFGDGTISSLANPTHTYNEPGEYTISLNGTSNNGCFAANAVTQQVTITDCTLDEPCDILFNWRTADTTICNGGNAMFQYSTNATQVILADENGNDIATINNNFYIFYNVTSSNCYQLHLVSATCEDWIPFCITVNSAIDFAWIDPPMDVCPGTIPELSFSTNMTLGELRSDSDMSVVYDYNPINNPQIIELDNLFDASCYTLELRENVMGCDTTIHFCIDLLTAPTDTTSLTLCEGTPYTLSTGEIVTQPGIYEDTRPSDIGCDTLLQIEIIYTGEDPETCDDNNTTTLDTYNEETCACEHELTNYIRIPSAFSPNSDGVNDTWKPVGVGFAELEMSIYNRWGTMLYNGSGVDAKWDGSYNNVAQDVGVYVYAIRYRLEQETELSMKKGNITLIR